MMGSDDEVRDVPGELSFERESAWLPLYEPDPRRSSDHDPVLVGLDLTGVTCQGLPVTISGTGGDDQLLGTDGPDVIHAFGGDDTIDGGNDRDVICGGSGADVVGGGNGEDVLDGGNSKDDGDGGAGDDACRGVEQGIGCEVIQP